jgi:hypothetical protein
VNISRIIDPSHLWWWFSLFGETQQLHLSDRVGPFLYFTGFSDNVINKFQIHKVVGMSGHIKIHIGTIGFFLLLIDFLVG